MKKMSNTIKRMTAGLLAAFVSISITGVGYAEDLPVDSSCDNDAYSDDCKDLGYIPDAGLGTPATYTGVDRSFGYIFYLYPDGSYFSKSGEECSCHGGEKGNPCKPKIACNCINFEDAIQCAGFAKKVYYETNGRSLPPQASQISKDMYLTVDSAKNLFMHNNTSPEAVYVRVNTRTDLDPKGEHSLVIVFSTSSKVTVYHANYGASCLVRYEDYTWENFVKAFPYLYRYSY
ncbi:MAG: hypothetical protein NC203_08410 [Firmicutes bacterium]|nr:hypothetical protein [[Eubacterium] siraeum]MCM1488373.1 hypothetical protein [Bacillota bacterium]